MCDPRCYCTAVCSRESAPHVTSKAAPSSGCGTASPATSVLQDTLLRRTKKTPGPGCCSCQAPSLGRVGRQVFFFSLLKAVSSMVLPHSDLKAWHAAPAGEAACQTAKGTRRVGKIGAAPRCLAGCPLPASPNFCPEAARVRRFLRYCGGGLGCTAAAVNFKRMGDGGRAWAGHWPCPCRSLNLCHCCCLCGKEHRDPMLVWRGADGAFRH